MPSADIERIRATLAVLIQPGGVAELRVPKVDRKKSRTDAGYFDNLDALAQQAARYDGRGDGIYITLNEINPALLPAPLTGSGNTTTSRRLILMSCAGAGYPSMLTQCGPQGYRQRMLSTRQR